MNLLFCCENYPPSIGGVQEVMRQIAERLVARGHTVTVATGDHPLRPKSATVAGVRVESFSVTGNLVRGMAGDIVRYRSAVLGGSYDAVLIKAAQQWTFDALISILHQIPSRLVFIPCGFSGFYGKAYRDYYRNMAHWLTEFDALIFYSSKYRDIDFAREVGLRAIHIVPNGVDEREFASNEDGSFRSDLGIGREEPLLLSVGTRILAKGHWEVTRAFLQARLPEPATLIINGNEPTGRPALRRVLALGRAREVPLKWLAKSIMLRSRGRRRVLLTGFSWPMLPAGYQAAGLFVSASRAADYSLVV